MATCAFCKKQTEAPRVIVVGSCKHDICTKCCKEQSVPDVPDMCPVCHMKCEHCSNLVTELRYLYCYHSFCLGCCNLMERTRRIPNQPESAKKEIVCATCKIVTVIREVDYLPVDVTALANRGVDLSKNEVLHTCRRHKGQYYTDFCNSCLTLACTKCVYSEHQGHDVMTCDEAAAKHRQAQTLQVEYDKFVAEVRAAEETTRQIFKEKVADPLEIEKERFKLEDYKKTTGQDPKTVFGPNVTSQQIKYHMQMVTDMLNNIVAMSEQDPEFTREAFADIYHTFRNRALQIFGVHHLNADHKPPKVP